MGSMLFSAVVVFIVVWIVLGTGRRQATYALRRVAMTQGGVFQHGGLFSRSCLLLNRGTIRLRIQFRPLAPLGGRLLLELSSAWMNRPSIDVSSPMEYAKLVGSDVAGQPSAIDLALTAERFKNLPSESTVLYASRGIFRLSTQLESSSPQACNAWFEMAVRLYELMLAHSEPGVQFTGTATASSQSDACCQVCGTHPDPRDTVLCDRCGAPHHAECWEYNGGCAIFGCGQRKQ